MPLPHLDLLIYAHDGRGLGHVSRSVAIGMACRRLFPDLKILLVSGSRQIADLIGPAPLDWIKLPAYETQVTQGISKGRPGAANIPDAELGAFRTEMLRQLVDLYRPRCVLSDHLPQGKHKELRGALQVSRDLGTKWVLGIRGIVGHVPGLWSDLALDLFRDYYQAVLWYGDVAVLGHEQLQSIQARFGIRPMETGYVSRLSESRYWQAWNPPYGAADPAVTVSIPWISSDTLSFLPNLAQAVKQIGSGFGNWHIYIGFGEDQDQQQLVRDLFQDLPFCHIRPIGEEYFRSLLCSKAALIYGGYNSLTDVLFAAVPSVVILRGMQDHEQELHLQRLNDAGFGFISLTEKKSTVQDLAADLEKQLSARPVANFSVNLYGAENAAAGIVQIMTSG